MGPSIRTPIGDLSSLAENLILLRFAELGARLRRLISVLKVRDSQFDGSLHEFVTSDQGLAIEATAESAERIMVGLANLREDEQDGITQPREGRDLL
jgi:circadian clock protein KaiC